ncbi:MAG TPA: DUF1844 domain-containing protein [Myxococcales bacterium]
MAEETRGSTFVMRGGAQKIAPKEDIQFSTFLLGLASTALIHLGQSPHPEGGAPATNMVLARQSLDLLAMLREKTEGNLSAEEDKLFQDLLADLRFRFVEASKR